jgi:lipase chaperone LimK
MTTRSVRRAAAAGLAAFGLTLGIWALREQPPAADTHAASVAGSLEPVVDPAPQSVAAPGAPTPPLPASLRGTDLPGGLAVDATGHFRATRDALDLFEYYFSASGEEPDEQIRQRNEAEIDARLEAPAREEALSFLDAYLRYREHARALFEGGFEDLPLETRFQRIRELRRSVFGAAEAEALFGAEEDRIRVDLERRRVVQDPELSADDREPRLAALDARLPPVVRDAQAAARAALDLRNAEARLRAEGAGASEIHALREQRFGPEAAARLAALDRERDAWQARLDEWRATRTALEAEFANDPAQLAATLEAARAERFTAREQIRVEALEPPLAP